MPCEKQTGPKYTKRDSPPYPAAECAGMTRKGNDGRMWVSEPAGRSHRWYPKAGARARKEGRKKRASKKASKRKASKRKASKRKASKRKASKKKPAKKKPASKRKASKKKKTSKKKKPAKKSKKKATVGRIKIKRPTLVDPPHWVEPLPETVSGDELELRSLEMAIWNANHPDYEWIRDAPEAIARAVELGARFPEGFHRSEIMVEMNPNGEWSYSERQFPEGWTFDGGDRYIGGTGKKPRFVRTEWFSGPSAGLADMYDYLERFFSGRKSVGRLKSYRMKVV